MRRYFNALSRLFRHNVPLLRLIELHGQRQDVHDVFGLILFTEAHPFVKKVLRDDDLWAALDRVSGTRWPIFTLRPKPGRYSPAPSSAFALNSLIQLPEVWIEPPENQLALEELGVADTSRLPLLLIFTQLRTGAIGQICWQFESGDSVESCYKSLSAVIESARSAIDQVTSANIKNNDEILELMRTAHLQYRLIKRAAAIPTLAGWATELFSKLRGN